MAIASMLIPVHASARSSATTIVVFPVPGPPVTSASGDVSAFRTARFCSSVRGGGPSATAFNTRPVTFGSLDVDRARTVLTRAQNRSSSTRIRSE
jgi:hypothetical protein